MRTMGGSSGATMESEFHLPIEKFQQTYTKFNEPTRELLRAIRQGRIIHGGNPLLRWAAMNLTTKTKEINGEELIMPFKRKSAGKIDPIVALIMALSRSMFSGDKVSVYERRGVLEL